MPKEIFETEYHKLARLIELTEILGQQSDFDEILRLVTYQATSLLRAESGLILMINPRTQNTIKTVFKGEREIGQRYQTMHTQVCGWVLKNNRALVSPNIQKDPRFRGDRFKELSIKSIMCAPLRTERAIIGSIMLLNKNHDGEFDESDLAYLEKLAAIAAPFLRNVQKIQEFFAAPLPEAALLVKYKNLGLHGKSKKFVELLQAIEAAARCDVRVLLEGQTGTGKELIARAIHQFSARHQGPFVAVDCGAIPQNLIESELFGHVKGAFTGATQDRKGLLEEANRGTLFMDEISNLPYDMQAKLLRVLQEGEVRVLGSNQPRKVDVRIIAASSPPLRNLVQSQQFREDLFYRLFVYPIYIPSLKERREDIAFLADHFLKKFSRQQRKQAEVFHAAMIAFMQQREWPGNIRELENFVERLVALASPEMTILDNRILPAEYLQEYKRQSAARAEPTIECSLQESLAEYEAELIRRALQRNDWNQSRAARLLKISERAIRYKMMKLGITKPPQD